MSGWSAGRVSVVSVRRAWWRRCWAARWSRRRLRAWALKCSRCWWRMPRRKVSLRTASVYRSPRVLKSPPKSPPRMFKSIGQHHHYFNMNALLLLALLATACALRPSEAGLNDWHLSNIGELTALTFAKTKLQYISALGQIGVLDRLTGKVESRFAVPDSEKVVAWSSGEITVATRHNQIVTYSFKPNGIATAVNNHALGQRNKIESYAKTPNAQYFLTPTTLAQDQLEIRQAKPEQQFLRVAVGVRSDGVESAFLAYSNGSEVCVESYVEDAWRKAFCGQVGEVEDLLFRSGRVFLAGKEATVVLSAELEVIQRVEERLVDVVREAAVFRSHSYDYAREERLPRQPIWTSHPEAAVSVAQSGSHLTVFRDDIELFQLPHDAARSQLLRGWLHLRSELQLQLVVQFSDLQLAAYSISKGEVELSWRREESLAHIQQAVFMKYNKLDDLDNPYHRHLISHAYRARSFTEKLLMVPRDIVLRFSEEVTDLLNHLVRAAEYLLRVGSIDLQSLRRFEMSKEQEVKYGLRKYLIATTALNTIIAIDSKTKAPLWKINHNRNQFVALVQLKRDYETENAVLVTYSPATSQAIIEEILESGEVVHLATLPSATQPTVYQLNDHSILLRAGERIQRFHLLQGDDQPQKEFYFYREGARQVEGWKVVGEQAVALWNFELQGSERVLATASAFRGHQISHIPLFDREKVFFKNVDFTNLAVLTSLNQTMLGLYILNGRTGNVQFSAFKKEVNNALPVNLVYDENNVLVSYFHARNKYFEIWTIEQYQERIESSALSMISDYLGGAAYAPQENREQTIFESEVYISPVAIKALYVSQSRQSLTRRNLFIVTRENKLYTINRDFVNTRRPRKDKDAKGFFSNEKLPEFNALLPFSPSNYLSYDLPLADLRSIIFSPADMESSIFVFCFGSDNFLIRTAPDKTFDMITSDFNYLVLLLILLAGTVAILVFGRMVKIAKLKKPHLE